MFRLVTLALVWLAATQLLFSAVQARDVPWWDGKTLPAGLSSLELDKVAAMTDHLVLSKFLPPFFVDPRPAGSEALDKVRTHIKNFFQALPGPWHFEEDRFTAKTPMGDIEFVNLIYTYNVNAPKRLMLAAHYESKYFEPPIKFFGATDSAVPCAMLMDVAEKLSPFLSTTRANYSLQIVFFDGEEAFINWSENDSLYGARHLSQLWATRDTEAQALIQQNASAILPPNRLSQIDLMVLFDLLGAPHARIRNMDARTTSAYRIFARIERRMRLRGHLPVKVDSDQYSEYLTTSEAEEPYFDIDSVNQLYGGIEDDHIPFQKRGVRTMDIIANPFPSVWHSEHDDQSHVSPGVILNWCLIVRTFVVEMLGLTIPKVAARDEL